MKSEGRFSPAAFTRVRGAGFSPIHGPASFSPCSKEKTKQNKTKTDKNVFVYLGLFSGPGQRPLRACPKDLTGREGAGQSMRQEEIQGLCHSCDSGVFQKQAHCDDSLDKGVTPEVSLRGPSCRSRGRGPAAAAAARGPPQPGRPACRQAGRQAGGQAGGRAGGWAGRQTGRGYCLWTPPPPSPCRASSDSFIQMQKAFQSSQSL